MDGPLRHSKLFIFIFVNLPENLKKKKIETILAKDVVRNYELGTSEAWLTSHLSQQTSEPAYHIVDCRIYVMACLLLDELGRLTILS